jgi:hypothetical protein
MNGLLDRIDTIFIPGLLYFNDTLLTSGLLYFSVTLKENGLLFPNGALLLYGFIDRFDTLSLLWVTIQP